jgi:hypothetical protein
MKPRITGVEMKAATQPMRMIPKKKKKRRSGQRGWK